jgi:hypothetical protein
MAVQVTTLFAPTQLTASAATIYTMGSSPSTLALTNGRVRFTNTDSGSHQVTAYAVPSAGTAGAGNCFMNAEAIAPNTHLDVALPLLGPGMTFQAFADAASKVTVTPLNGILQS